MRHYNSEEPSSRAERKGGSRMELIFIGVVIFLIWLVPALHKIRRREQEEADRKVAFAKWAREQHHPDIVSMVQNFMTEGRFKTWEEAATYAEQVLNTTPSPGSPSTSHSNDAEEKSS
jgi:hypothetical protein